MCCFEVTVSFMHHSLPMVTLYCLFRVFSKPETNNVRPKLVKNVVSLTFLQVPTSAIPPNRATWEQARTGNFFHKAFLVRWRILNFTVIDIVKFILFQSQIHIYFRVFMWKQLPQIACKRCSCLCYNYKLESEVTM